eukprot:713793_1
MAENITLIVITCVVVFVSFLLLVPSSHPDDKNDTLLPKDYSSMLEAGEGPWGKLKADAVYAPRDFSTVHDLADTEDMNEARNLPFNQIATDSRSKTKKIDRTTFNVDADGKHIYQLDSVSGLPLNPRGRTGLSGRGELWRWGPNHAADPVVTRWKRDAKGQPIRKGKDGKPVMELVVIKRRDTGEWAFPGGMVEPGDSPGKTLVKEFCEEAMNSDSWKDLSGADRKQKEIEIQGKIETEFKDAPVIYKGIVDDRRNTDNAWMETVAANQHDDTGESIMSSLKLEAGSDAEKVKWVTVDSHLKLYASHAKILKMVVDDRNAFWE